jgi:hypothetical protein
VSKDKLEKAPKPMMDEESFTKQVVQASAVADFESDAEAFARSLWPMVNRVLEAAFDDGQRTKKSAENPYRMDNS